MGVSVAQPGMAIVPSGCADDATGGGGVVAAPTDPGPKLGVPSSLPDVEGSGMPAGATDSDGETPRTVPTGGDMTSEPGLNPSDVDSLFSSPGSSAWGAADSVAAAVADPEGGDL